MSQWNDLTSIFFFLQYIYAVNRNKFSPFWVHEQRDRINFIRIDTSKILSTCISIIFDFTVMFIILREYNRTTLSAKF